MDLETKRNAMLVSAVGNLPSEYQQVEWIGASGTQYIDSGVKLNEPTKIEGECSFSNVGRMGMITDSVNRAYFGIAVQNYWAFAYGATNDYNHYAGASDTDKHIFKMNLGSCHIDDVFSYSAVISQSTFYLFAINHNGSEPYANVAGKIYSFKFYKNDILERDFIPCYRKSDGEIGLYDLVYEQFYTNQGTGVFTKGGDV